MIRRPSDALLLTMLLVRAQHVKARLHDETPWRFSTRQWMSPMSPRNLLSAFSQQHSVSEEPTSERQRATIKMSTHPSRTSEAASAAIKGQQGEEQSKRHNKLTPSLHTFSLCIGIETTSPMRAPSAPPGVPPCGFGLLGSRTTDLS